MPSPMSPRRRAATASAGWSPIGDRGHRLEGGWPDGIVAIDLDDPRRGLSCPPHHLLGLDLRSEARLTEHWLRGADATAVYEPADPRRLRATAMWRLHPGLPSTADRQPPASGCELVVSAQTSLEESDASLGVVSDVEAAHVLCGRAVDDASRWMPEPFAGMDCILLRPTAPAGAVAGPSVLVAAHPADVRRLLVRREGGRVRIECGLFPTLVEKGVLLRGRVLAAVGPSRSDTEWAAGVVRWFAASPPFLST